MSGCCDSYDLIRTLTVGRGLTVVSTAVAACDDGRRHVGIGRPMRIHVALTSDATATANGGARPSDEAPAAASGRQVQMTTSATTAATATTR